MRKAADDYMACAAISLECMTLGHSLLVSPAVLNVEPEEGQLLSLGLSPLSFLQEMWVLLTWSLSVGGLGGRRA